MFRKNSETEVQVHDVQKKTQIFPLKITMNSLISALIRALRLKKTELIYYNSVLIFNGTQALAACSPANLPSLRKVRIT